MSDGPLLLRVNVSPELVRPGATVNVIYRRWGGPAVTETAVSVPLEAAGELALTVPLPSPGARSTLPPALGGPWHFAIGYIAVTAPVDTAAALDEDAASKLHDGRSVVAVAAGERVLWLESRFPLDAFAVATAGATLADEERDAMHARLRALPEGGITLAKATESNRSLGGFVPLGEDHVVELSAARQLPWPPMIF